MKTTLRLRTVVIEQCRNVSVALILYSMLLTPLLFLGEGLGVRCLAQANGTGAGNCLSYDGVSNYVKVPNSSSLSTFNSLTHSYWIKFNSFCSDWTDVSTVINNHIHAVGSPISGVISCVFSTGQAGFQLRLNNICCQTLSSTTVLSTNTWYHIANTWDGNTMKIYINGQLDCSMSASGTLQINRDTYIGINAETKSEGNNFSQVNGQIDEVSIWNTARTETEIRDNMCKKLTGSESGLVGYWRFDEGSGGTAYDATTNGNNGTLY